MNMCVCVCVCIIYHLKKVWLAVWILCLLVTYMQLKLKALLLPTMLPTGKAEYLLGAACKYILLHWFNKHSLNQVQDSLLAKDSKNCLTRIFLHCTEVCKQNQHLHTAVYNILNFNIYFHSRISKTNYICLLCSP